MTPSTTNTAAQAGKSLYDEYSGNHPTIHSNRFPSWSELTQAQRDEWNRKAPESTIPPQAATLTQQQGGEQEGGEVVCYGLRRKGSTAIIGIVPNKVAAKPATVEWFNENYEEVPLCLATPAPDTTSVSLCPTHGMYAKKGCAVCEAVIDMLTRIEPPDPSPTHPAAAQEPTK